MFGLRLGLSWVRRALPVSFSFLEYQGDPLVYQGQPLYYNGRPVSTIIPSTPPTALFLYENTPLILSDGNPLLLA
jgi:hypothetical protein